MRCGTVATSGGFTIIELLVVISIVTILTALLMPTLARVRAAGERIQCANNMRQIGCGISEYSQDNRDRLPVLDFTAQANIAPRFAEAMALTDENGRKPDGLGRLVLGFGGGYVSDPRVLFCPCHCGEHTFERYQGDLEKHATLGYGSRVFCNYHYRGTVDPVTHQPLPRTIRPDLVLLVDGLRTRRDFNHVIGTNRLKADGSVDWFMDTHNWIYKSLPIEPTGIDSTGVFETIWRLIDQQYEPDNT